MISARIRPGISGSAPSRSRNRTTLIRLPRVASHRNDRLCPPLLACRSDGSCLRYRFTALKSPRRTSFSILSIPKRPLWPARGFVSFPHPLPSDGITQVPFTV